jgi:hypothetical protein
MISLEYQALQSCRTSSTCRKKCYLHLQVERKINFGDKCNQYCTAVHRFGRNGCCICFQNMGAHFLIRQAVLSVQGQKTGKRANLYFAISKIYGFVCWGANSDIFLSARPLLCTNFELLPLRPTSPSGDTLWRLLSYPQTYSASLHVHMLDVSNFPLTTSPTEI